MSSDTPAGLDKMIDPSSIRRSAQKKVVEKRRVKGSQELMSKEAQGKIRRIASGLTGLFKGKAKSPALQKPLGGGTIKPKPTAPQKPVAPPPAAAKPAVPAPDVTKLQGQMKEQEGQLSRMQDISSGKIHEPGHTFGDIQKVHQGRFSRFATSDLGQNVLGMGSFIALPMVADMLGLGMTGQIGSLVAAPMLSGYMTKGFAAGKARALSDYQKGRTAPQAQRVEQQRVAQKAIAR